MLKKLVLCLAGMITCAVVHAAEQPNVIIIYADDMGYRENGTDLSGCFKTNAPEGVNLDIILRG